MLCEINLRDKVFFKKKIIFEMSYVWDFVSCVQFEL